MKSLVLAGLVCMAAGGGRLLQGQQGAGFRADAPAGWTTKAGEGRVEMRSADGAEFVAVEAVLGIEEQRTAEAILRGLPGRGRYLGGQAIGRGEATGAFEQGRMRVHALLALRGKVGTLMLVGAPRESLTRRLPELVRILGSFRFVERGKQGGGGSLAFARVQEQRENAFSVELPQGWRNEVTLHRLGATDTRPEVLTQSADGSVFAFSGDRNLGRFMTVTPQMAQFGAREGGAYNTGTGTFTYMRYLPPVQFAQGYLHQRFGGARVAAARELPEQAGQMSATRYRYGNPNRSRLESGEVDFEWQGKTGRLVVTTEVSANPMGGYFWSVIYLQGYVAEPSRAASGVAVAARLLQSGRVNPQWMMGELRMQADIAKQNIDALHETQAVQARMMNERWASMDRRANLAGEELSGRYQMRDPVSGETVSVEAGSNFYYRLGRNGGVAGTKAELGNYIQGDGGPIEVTRLLRVGVE